MKLTLSDLDYEQTKEVLLQNGFSLVEAEEPYSEGRVIELARIWSTTYGESAIPGGYVVGSLIRGDGSFPRYTLSLEDGWAPRERVIPLITSIMEKVWRR